MGTDARLSRQRDTVGAPSGSHGRLVRWILLCVAVTGGCGAPITVERTDPLTVHRELTSSVLSTGELSRSTHNVLHRWNVHKRFDESVPEAIAELHQAVVTGAAGSDELVALSELSFFYARKTNQPTHYLASVVYAYAFLFPGEGKTPPDPFDPRLRLAANLYNRGLTQGFAVADEVVLRSGTFPLPFGALTVRFDEAGLRWGDRKLEHFVPVAELEVEGLQERYRRSGIGAPLAASTSSFEKDRKLRDFVGKKTKVPVTAVLRFQDLHRDLAKGDLAVMLEVHDAYQDEHVVVDHRSVPLEVEPTAVLAYTLSQSKVWDWELKGFLFGDLLPGFIVGDPQGKQRTQMLFLHPYRPGRIPVVFVHGTASGPGRWADMVNSLANDRELRERYQFWFFYYETGNPILYSADTLRESLRNIVDHLDPEQQDPALRQMVVIGHSQGGLLTKMTAIDSGTHLWDQFSAKSIDEAVLRDGTRDLLRRTLFVKPLPFVSRVVFMATPHRGSYMAGNRVAHWLAGFVKLPKEILGVGADLVTGDVSAITLSPAGGFLSSVHGMTPGNSFIQALSPLPIAPPIAAHSVIAVETEGVPQEGNDGVVEYASAHIDGVASELVVRSGHSVQSHPLAIAEVGRILKLHMATTATASR
ncbi:MAG: hypothetical protein ABL970_19090 [Nitrospira sp.]